MNDERLVWHPAGIYRGLFDGFVITSNRHLGENGKTAWHVRSYRNSGDSGHRDYWVVDGQFSRTLRHGVDNTIVTGGPIEVEDVAERDAILTAIAEWSSREPDSLD